jgi:hypothetical protein
VDGIVKFWDLRSTAGGAAAQATPPLELARLCDAAVPQLGHKQHGITSLAMHPEGTRELAWDVGSQERSD